MEQLDYNLLFRWFVGLSMDDEVWDASTFSKNRERLLEGDIAEGDGRGKGRQHRVGGERAARRHARHDQDQEAAVEGEIFGSAGREPPAARNEPADPRHRVPAVWRVAGEEVERRRQYQHRHHGRSRGRARSLCRAPWS